MKRKFLIVLSSFLLIIAIVILNIGRTYSKELNIDEVLKTKSYSSLSQNVKDFIKNYYEENKVILLTSDLAGNGEPYLNPSYIKYLDSNDKSNYGVIPSVIAYNPIIKSNTRKGGTKSPQILPSKFDLIFKLPSPLNIKSAFE